MAAGALTSSVTMAALLLAVAAMALQTAATRPAAEVSYAASATPAAKPAAEEGYSAAASKPAAAEKSGGEAAVSGGSYDASGSKPAETAGGEARVVRHGPNVLASASVLGKIVDKYKFEAATETSPKRAAGAKVAAEFLAGVAKLVVPPGEKYSKETGEKDVTRKDIEMLTVEIKKTMKSLVDAGRTKGSSYDELQMALKFLEMTDGSIQDVAAATSPEKMAVAKKNANGSFITAALYVAQARAQATAMASSAADGSATVDVKSSAKPAGESYAAPKEAAAKEEAVAKPAGETYAAPKEEAVAKPAGESYAAPKEAAAKETYA